MHLALPPQPSYFRTVKPTYAAYPEFDSLDETPLTAVELLTDDAYDLAVSQAADFYTATSAPHPSPVPTKAHDSAYYYPWQVSSKPANTTATTRPASPTRPRFKRRDTPRPVETISTLTATSLSYDARMGMGKIEETKGKRYTSMVDGGHWVVVA